MTAARPNNNDSEDKKKLQDLIVRINDNMIIARNIYIKMHPVKGKSKHHHIHEDVKNMEINALDSSRSRDRKVITSIIEASLKRLEAAFIATKKSDTDKSPKTSGQANEDFAVNVDSLVEQINKEPRKHHLRRLYGLILKDAYNQLKKLKVKLPELNNTADAVRREIISEKVCNIDMTAKSLTEKYKSLLDVIDQEDILDKERLAFLENLLKEKRPLDFISSQDSNKKIERLQKNGDHNREEEISLATIFNTIAAYNSWQYYDDNNPKVRFQEAVQSLLMVFYDKERLDIDKNIQPTKLLEAIVKAEKPTHFVIALFTISLYRPITNDDLNTLKAWDRQPLSKKFQNGNLITLVDIADEIVYPEKIIKLLEKIPGIQLDDRVKGDIRDLAGEPQKKYPAHREATDDKEHFRTFENVTYLKTLEFFLNYLDEKDLSNKFSDLSQYDKLESVISTLLKRYGNLDEVKNLVEKGKIDLEAVIGSEHPGYMVKLFVSCSRAGIDERKINEILKHPVVKKLSDSELNELIYAISYATPNAPKDYVARLIDTILSHENPKSAIKAFYDMNVDAIGIETYLNKNKFYQHQQGNILKLDDPDPFVRVLQMLDREFCSPYLSEKDGWKINVRDAFKSEIHKDLKNITKILDNVDFRNHCKSRLKITDESFDRMRQDIVIKFSSPSEYLDLATSKSGNRHDSLKTKNTAGPSRLFRSISQPDLKQQRDNHDVSPKKKV